jgi:hypothetical protein
MKKFPPEPQRIKFTHCILTVTELPEGILSAKAKFVFAHGHCHSFALALAQLTGGELYAQHCGGGRRIRHIWVRLPNSNTLVDAEEKFEIDPRYPHRHRDTIAPLPKGYTFTGRGWRRAQPEKAMSFAKARLAELRGERKRS